MKRDRNLSDVGSTTRRAAARGQAAFDDAVEKLTPLVEQAADLLEQASDRVRPLAKDYRAKGAAALDAAVDRLTPLVEQAGERLSEAGERLAPIAHDYKVRGAAAAARAMDNLQPRLSHALDRVPPAVDAAQRRVQDELIPKLVTLLHEAAESPALSDAAARMGSELAPTKKRGVGSTIAKVAAAGALVAGVAVAVRVFLKTKDSGWAAHEPSAAYVYAEEPATFDDEVDFVDVDLDEEPDVAPDTSSDDDSAEVDETRSAAEYGEGAYVGDEPPEGYNIKGNERSSKYHTPESGVYERTKADVWFNSEEAASAAGFSRAQR